MGRYEWIVDFAGRQEEAGVGCFCLDGSEYAELHFYWGVDGERADVHSHAMEAR